MADKNVRTAGCLCGEVEWDTLGEPVVSAACHCGDCREGSRRLEALPKAPRILDEFGGTPHLLYRRDRIVWKKGMQLFRSLKVDEDSPNRTYASCCNSYLFLDAGPRMDWLPIFRGRFRSDVPAIEMRMNAKFKPGSENVPNDVPCSASFPFKFVRRLLASKLAIVFKL